MRTLSILSAAIALVSASVAGAAVQFTVTDIESLSTGGSRPTGISPTGFVGGTAIASSGQATAVAYNSLGGFQPSPFPLLSVMSSASSYGMAIGGTNSSTIVGFGMVDDRNMHATKNGADIHAAVATGPFGAVAASRALGINASGAIVGQAGAQGQAFYLPAAGPAQGVPFLAGMVTSVATAVSDSNVVVGFNYTGTWNYLYGSSLVNGASTSKAFMWTAGDASAVSLGALGTGTNSYATSVATVGGVTTIVGQSTITPGAAIATNGHAFIYSGSTMSALAELAGATFSIADDINSAGDVVGSVKVGSATHAFLYHAGVMTDLNSLIATGSGWVFQEATSINDDGYITGYGTHNGVSSAFLLTPTGATLSVPEPASVSVLGLGLVTLAAKRRRA